MNKATWRFNGKRCVLEARYYNALYTLYPRICVQLFANMSPKIRNYIKSQTFFYMYWSLSHAVELCMHSRYNFISVNVKGLKFFAKFLKYPWE